MHIGDISGHQLGCGADQGLAGPAECCHVQRGGLLHLWQGPLLHGHGVPVSPLDSFVPHCMVMDWETK